MRAPHLLPVVCGTLTLAVLAGCGTALVPGADRKPSALSRAAQADAWEALPDAPSPRFNAAAVPVGFTLHVLGGQDASGTVGAHQTFKAFDKWASAPALPTARTGAGAAFLPAMRVAVFGGLAGGKPSAAAEMFEAEKGTWEKLPAMPTARAFAGVAQVGVFAYVAGGTDGRPSNAFEVFDVRDRSWKQLPAMPTARAGCVAAKLGQRVVVVGGHTGSGVTGATEVFNWEKGEWTKGAAMPTPRAHAAFAIYGHHLFVLGGQTASGATDAVESYDFGKNTWTKRAPLPVALHGAAAAKLGERLVVTGGVVDGKPSVKGWKTTFPFGTK